MSGQEESQEPIDAEGLRQEREEAETELQLAQDYQAVQGFVAKMQTSDEQAERDALNQIIGQVQQAQSWARLANVVELSLLKEVKENRRYRALNGVKAFDKDGNEIPNVGTWDGFCKALGMSSSKVDEDLKHLAVFGEEALQAMNNLGLGYRHIRKLRELPEEDRQVVVNEVEVHAGDKEAVASLIDDLVARHQREKEELEREKEGLQGDLQAKDRVLEQKNQRINDLEEEAGNRANRSPDEKAQELSRRLDMAVRANNQFMDLRAAIQLVQEWEEAPRELHHACAQAVARMRVALDELQTDYQLPPVDLDFDDSWMDKIGEEPGDAPDDG